MEYLTAKWLHVLSSTILFGTGIGTAFYMFVANRSRNLDAIVVVTRWVVRADWAFTGTAAIVQPLTGLWMVHLANLPMLSPAGGLNWISLSFVLYFVTGACWLPVVWLQIRMSRMAAQCQRQGVELPLQYWKLERLWCLLGLPAFSALVWVFYLMVVKPF
ncbi:DUF2269 family protein [Chitinimonas lacunae]|uniref:DUF2269 family protein n=1 Tax=Chitinimonas lacunae TaxID=1963018 RepID=A0ABV8MM37_9NEIS